MLGLTAAIVPSTFYFLSISRSQIVVDRKYFQTDLSRRLLGVDHIVGSPVIQRGTVGEHHLDRLILVRLLQKRSRCVVFQPVYNGARRDIQQEYNAVFLQSVHIVLLEQSSAAR